MLSVAGSLLLLLFLLLFVLWAIHIFKHFVKPKFTNQPPVISGWFPFIGCAISFGKGPPVMFIKQCQKKYGNTFTLHIAGRYLTFLMNPEDTRHFFSRDESTVDFQYATQPFLTRCFGVSKERYFAAHEKLLHIVRTNLLATKMDEYIPSIHKGFQEHLEKNWQSGEEKLLWRGVRELNFKVTLRALFGNIVEKENGHSFLETFHQFDEWFEIASSDIPHAFLPRFTGPKQKLLSIVSKFACSYSEKPQHEPPLTAEVMRQELGIEGLENWLLAMVWAGEANTIPTLFWTLFYLIDHPSYLEQVEKELVLALSGRTLGELSFKELMAITTLKNAVNETIRMHSPPIIVRGARKPVQVKDFLIPVGQFLCLSPFWAQRDESSYSCGDTWTPERWDDINISSPSSPVFLAFGKGKYRCPGQSFAYTGMMLALAQLITTYSFSFPTGSKRPEIDPNNLVGLTKPLKDITILIIKK